MPGHRTVSECTTTERRRALPLEPLLTYLRAYGGPEAHDTVKRCRQHGWIGERAADRFACRVLGVHPALIWGEAWWDQTASPRPVVGSGDAS